MKGIDPNSSNVSTQYPKQEKPAKAEETREVKIGDKEAKLSTPKKWLNRLISVLSTPSEWGRSIKAKLKTISPFRHTPQPKDQPPKAEGTPLQERSVTTVNGSETPSVRRGPLPAPPVSERPALKPKPRTSNGPALPPRSSNPDSPALKPRPSGSNQPQPRKPVPEVMPQPKSLVEFGTHFAKGDYFDQTGNINKNLVKVHLGRLSKEQLRPVKSNDAFKSLPLKSKTLVQEVYAEKKVTEEIAKISDGSPEERQEKLQNLRERLGVLYTNKETGQPAETSRLLVKEFDRQLLTEKYSAAYDAKTELDPKLQDNFPDDKELKENLTEENKQILRNYARLKLDSQDITEALTARADRTQRFQSEAVPKFRDIVCDKDSCAAEPNHLYHCNTVETPSGTYVAAQGCVEETEANFISMLAYQKSAISVSLVSKEELDAPKITPDNPIGKKSNKRTTSAGPRNVGEEKTYNNVTVKLENQFWLDDGNIRVDVLKLDGEQHFRVYDTGWEDHTSGNPSRLAALSVLIEQLRQDPSVADRKDNPTIVNCNAGIGRTGTLITLNSSTREYLEHGQVTSNVDDVILKARETRKSFVQTAGQHNTLKALHQDLPSVLNPLLNAAGLEVPEVVHEAVADNEADVYENLRLSPSDSEEAAEAESIASSQHQTSGTVSTAKQFMERFTSGEYNHENFWDAVSQDISTIHNSTQLRILTSEISNFAKDYPEYEEAAMEVQKIVDQQMESIAEPGSVVDSINKPPIQVR
ncbi:hypothetical protein GZ77_01755 [Endozoicomonas montiporae]|uniref:Tyrosine specific protein phosphatases domain-containing protein n=2 Tax=Endozoicomonas montiporae TaxID=1027273 RepID=A0A081NAC5_9GAMM|nr:protein-tyrosine phosphatase family protein [Endozoicomonas montiporae]AMO56922.1 nonreceptor type protein tyrosine phosphatase [Endozoicomonas montiporae CL-33]KEQ15398.1 hypothetical protein GZ77_01755 [Endozoicomonas montiporae]